MVNAGLWSELGEVGIKVGRYRDRHATRAVGGVSWGPA